MKKLFLAVLCLSAWWLLLTGSASAAVSDIKIRHLSPADKATIHGDTAEFSWEVVPKEKIKGAWFVVYGPRAFHHSELISGDVAAQHRTTVSGFIPNEIYLWHLAFATDEGDASFGEFPCFFFYTKP